VCKYTRVLVSLDLIATKKRLIIHGE